MVSLNWNRKNIIGLVYVVLFVILMTYALAERGLFFRPQQTYAATATILVGLLGLITLTILKEFRIPGWLFAMSGYAAYAWLSTLWAADAELAVGGALTITAGVLLTAFVPALTRVWRRVLVSLIALMPVILYLFAMGTVFHWYSFVNAIQTNMMDSVFQYHNTFGSFSLAGALMALTLAMSAKKYIGQAMYYLVATVDLVGVFASYSRFVWVLTVMMLLMFLATGLFSRRRLQTLLSGVLIPLVAAVAGALTIQSIHKSSFTDFVLSLAVAILGVALVSFFIRFVLRVPARNKRMTLSLALIVVPLVLGVVLAMVDAQHFGSILQRLQSIRFQSASLQGRFWFYGAALHMWEHNPVFGSAAGTWTAKFQAYQQFPYYSTMTHSVLFSQLTDFGIVGTLLWFLFLVHVVMVAIRAIRHDWESALVPLAALLGALSLWLHALMDFDMDFPVILSLLFVLLGLATPFQREVAGIESPRPTRLVLKVSLFTATGLLSIVGLGLSFAEGAIQATTRIANLDSKVPLLKRAEFYAPYLALPHANLATIYFDHYNTSHAVSDQTNAWQEAQYAAKRGKWNAVIQEQVATIAYQMGHSPEAYRWGLKASTDAPFNITYPTTFAGMALWLGVSEYPNNPTDARNVFQAVVSTYQQAVQNTEKLKNLPSDVTAQWVSNIKAYQVSAAFQTYAAAAEYGLGNYQASINDLHFLSNVGQDYNTLGLYEMVVFLDDARLGHGSMTNIPNEMHYKNTILTDEYQALAKIRPAH